MASLQFGKTDYSDGGGRATVVFFLQSSVEVGTGTPGPPKDGVIGGKLFSLSKLFLRYCTVCLSVPS